jgi:hypothetical protein
LTYDCESGEVVVGCVHGHDAAAPSAVVVVVDGSRMFAIQLVD